MYVHKRNKTVISQSICSASRSKVSSVDTSELRKTEVDYTISRNSRDMTQLFERDEKHVIKEKILSSQ